MPYYWGEGDPGWNDGDDDEHEYRPPKVSQFHYDPPFRVLPGPEVVRVLEPVPFSDRPPPPSALPQSPAAPVPGLLDRLLGRRPPAPEPARRLSPEEQRQEWERRGQHAIALFVAALREVGVRRIYCRYDGGNDEGFSWLDHAELRSGERLGADAVAARLARTELLERIMDVPIGHRRRGWTRTRNVHDVIDITLVPELAARLLGGGYGTGAFCMYGAFTVDLDACTIADDPAASPVTRHFTIED